MSRHKPAYDWAGQLRTVNMSKGDTLFALAQWVEPQGRQLFDDLAHRHHLRGLDPDAFVTTAGQFLSDLNALHPFREGNGRTQRAFLQLLANQASWQLAWARIDPAQNNVASARAMSDRDAFRPLLDRITLAADEALRGDALALPHEHDEPADPILTESAARLASEAYPRALFGPAGQRRKTVTIPADGRPLPNPLICHASVSACSGRSDSSRRAGINPLPAETVVHAEGRQEAARLGGRRSHGDRAAVVTVSGCRGACTACRSKSTWPTHAMHMRSAGAVEERSDPDVPPPPASYWSGPAGREGQRRDIPDRLVERLSVIDPSV